MKEKALTDETDDSALLVWCQGDYAMGVGGLIFAGVSDDSKYPYSVREIEEDIVGLIVITQTCDIVRRTGGRHHVQVCPLVKRKESEVTEILRGRKPYYAEVETTDENVFADLRQIMTVSKDLLKQWSRKQGFTSQDNAINFSSALERKLGRFAFPDEFDHALNDFRNRVWKRHDKQDSDIGKIYRSILQIRFKAMPNWDAQNREITLIAVLLEEEKREIDRDAILNELNDFLSKVTWTNGFKWADPKVVALTAKELSADELLSSQKADFDFLCR